MKILVVDDSSVMRKLVTRSIRQAGYGHAEVSEAEDGAKALEAINSDRPDLVLADWNMPNMTGIEMLQALRENGDDIKVGFITSESTSEAKSSAQQFGASFLLTKPIDTSHLEAVLDKVGA
ncbi:MAG: response regulator [Actinomycetota bacterium]